MLKFWLWFTALSGLGIVVILSIGTWLVSPKKVVVGEPPHDLAMESVLLPTSNVAAWYHQGVIEQGGVLLLHSIGANRLEMLGRARFLIKAGYSVLMIDLPAHGESAGQHISFGYLESHSVVQAITYLHHRLAHKSIGVIGVSLGGASTLLGQGPIAVNALVLESVYSTIEMAIANRIAFYLGDWARPFSVLLSWQLAPRLALDPNLLAPIRVISQLTSPVLIMAGDADQRTLLSETKALYQQAAMPKALWVVAGAKHENLYQYAPEQYEAKVLDFFQRFL